MTPPTMRLQMMVAVYFKVKEDIGASTKSRVILAYLSGGEKQRVALARAMMRNVPIYIFDEATCHLDFESENLIIDYIRKKLLEQTCIIISHNANLLNDNDIVLFIDSTGKLHKNKHSHLLENNLEYNQIIISRNPE